MAAVAALVLLLGALLVVAARREREDPSVAMTEGFTHPPASAGQVLPSRENVAPAFSHEITALQQRLAANPADSASLLRLARLQQDAHQPAASARYYRQYLQRAPGDRQAWLDLAAVTAATGDWDGALAATTALLARDSLDPAALFNRGAIHANRGETAEARRWWARAAAQTRDPQLAQQAAAALRRLAGGS